MEFFGLNVTFSFFESLLFYVTLINGSSIQYSLAHLRMTLLLWHMVNLNGLFNLPINVTLIVLDLLWQLLLFPYLAQFGRVILFNLVFLFHDVTVSIYGSLVSHVTITYDGVSLPLNVTF